MVGEVFQVIFTDRQCLLNELVNVIDFSVDGIGQFWCKPKQRTLLHLDFFTVWQKVANNLLQVQGKASLLPTVVQESCAVFLRQITIASNAFSFGKVKALMKATIAMLGEDGFFENAMGFI